MDVLEHVEDDLALLREYVIDAPQGASFLVSVPCFSWLWSGHDVFLGHKRRYILSEIEDCCRKSGLSVLQASYYFSVVFPLAALTRLWGNLSGKRTPPKSQLTLHHPVVNNILFQLCSWELPLMKHNRAWGLTAFVLAEKKA